MTSRLHIIGRRHIYPDVGGYSRGSLYFQCIFGSYRVFPVYHLVKHGIRNPDNRRKLSNSLFRFGFLFDGFAAVRAAYYAHSLMEQSLLYPVHPDAPADAGSARYRFLHPLHLCLLRQQAERDQPLHHRKLLESKGRIKHSDSSRELVCQRSAWPGVFFRRRMAAPNKTRAFYRTARNYLVVNTGNKDWDKEN